MFSLDVGVLRSRIDTENLFVDFNLLRTSLTVTRVAGDLNISLSEPNKEDECRGQCPKCQKEKSFSLNVHTSRFNCFAKGCKLKGGGVIDFFAKLNGVSAKEASHLLACAYGIQPYTQKEIEGTDDQPTANLMADRPSSSREALQPSSEAQQSPADAPPLTAQHLIASIEHQLAQLKQLLASR